MGVNWKEFLGPTWQKLLTFVLFPPLVLFIINLFTVYAPASGSNYIAAFFFHPLEPLLGGLYPDPLATPPQSIMFALQFGISHIVYEIANFIYFYILSCLIVFAYGKLTEKKTGKKG